MRWSRIAFAAANSSNSLSLDAVYSSHTAIKLILHKRYLQRDHRLARRQPERSNSRSLPITTLGSIWLRALFPKLAHSIVRQIRVASEQEFKDRLMTAVNHFDREQLTRSTRPRDINSNFKIARF
jgi:hypothetical protein